MNRWYSNSTYLEAIARRYPYLVDENLDSFECCLEQLAKIKRQVSEISMDDIASTNIKLRDKKAEHDWYWSFARLHYFNTNDYSNSQQLGCARTDFADASIQKALEVAWQESRNKKILANNAPEKPTGLFVFGMGKLGGQDLNFSSDVDLIAFYNKEIFPKSPAQGANYSANSILKLTTKLLTEVIDGQFVWRVDWRLRPDASVNAIVMEYSAGMEFYRFRSLPWHHLALVKARTVAGDIKQGNAMLEELEHYIWREHLDYFIVDNVFAIKKHIDKEHPQLKSDNRNNSFNLKLGSGGIREIEFVANVLQLLWGGKKTQLRCYQTYSTYKFIKQLGYLPDASADAMLEAYHFLRWVEDGIQLLGNQQRHSIPRQEGILQKLIALLNIEATQQLLLTIDCHRNQVKRHYQSFFEKFEGHRQYQYEPDVNSDDSHLFEQLGDNQYQIVRNWSDGFTLYGAQTEQFHQLKPLYYQLIKLINQLPFENHTHNTIVERIHQFLTSIPKGAMYLRIFASHPIVIQAILEAYLYAPPMRILLEQSPYIIDSVIDANFEYQSDFVLNRNDFEWRLKKLRQFVNEQLYGNMHRLISGNIGAEQLSLKLTTLAEDSIRLGLQIVCDDMQLTEAPINVVGCGKLGMGYMQPLSDLDLVFVSKYSSDQTDLEDIHRFTRRFQHLMEVKTREGRAYEMDTRLRPSGKSGAVTVSLDNFENYHLTKARNWEHIALLHSRVIGEHGNEYSETETRLNNFIGKIIDKPRDSEQFLMDAAKMLNRVREQRTQSKDSGALVIKLRPGGVFETDYLIACSRLIDAAIDGDRLNKISSFWRNVQLWSRIYGLEQQAINTVPKVLIDCMLKDLSQLTAIESFEALQVQVNEYSHWVVTQLDTLLANTKPREHNWGKWLEEAVIWV